MMNKVSILFLLLFCVYVNTGFSQNVLSIKGKVVDKKSGEPVIAAAVNLKEIERWTIADDKGQFEFKSIIPKTYTIQVQCLGYEFYSSSVLITLISISRCF